MQKTLATPMDEHGRALDWRAHCHPSRTLAFVGLQILAVFSCTGLLGSSHHFGVRSSPGQLRPGKGAPDVRGGDAGGRCDLSLYNSFAGAPALATSVGNYLGPKWTAGGDSRKQNGR